LAVASATTRLALVTGTTSGIGAALAKQLLQRGWEVAGVARRTPAIENPRYHHLAVDLRDVPMAVKSIDRKFGPLLRDQAWQRVGLVNNAASASLLGPVHKLDAHELLRSYAINAAIPTWLMGFVMHNSHRGAMIRIVNVSSGAAVRAFPGLAAYCGSKAALRMAGMVVAAELESPLRPPVTSNVAILSYEPGVVDTEMQLATRSKSQEEFPWVETFRGFAAQGALVAPEIPAAEIVEFLEADGGAHFIERRRGG
jgi:benzil reductase ((S)-benzoin forming)